MRERRRPRAGRVSSALLCVICNTRRLAERVVSLQATDGDAPSAPGAAPSRDDDADDADAALSSPAPASNATAAAAAVVVASDDASGASSDSSGAAPASARDVCACACVFCCFVSAPSTLKMRPSCALARRAVSRLGESDASEDEEEEEEEASSASDGVSDSIAWREGFDVGHKRMYYFNHLTGESRWVKPSEPYHKYDPEPASSSSEEETDDDDESQDDESHDR